MSYVRPADFGNVVFQMDFEDYASSTDFKDTSNYAHTIVTAGTPTITEAAARYGKGGLDYLDATDTLSITASSDEFQFADEDFLIEFYIDMESQNQAWHLSVYNTSNNERSWGIRSNTLGDGLALRTSTNGSGAGDPFSGDITGVLAAGYTHVAIVRTGDVLSAYVNGTRNRTTAFTDTLHDSTEPLRVGFKGGGGGKGEGLLDNIRIIKGESIYDANDSSITVPTGNFSGRRRDYWF